MKRSSQKPDTSGYAFRARHDQRIEICRELEQSAHSQLRREPTQGESLSLQRSGAGRYIKIYSAVSAGRQSF